MTTTVRPVASTHTLPMEIVQQAALIGQVVTLNSRQYTVHSVEGRDWYAFDQDGQVTIDQSMTPANWITTPVAVLLPMGTKIGQGFAVECEVTSLARKVCLTKW